MLLADGIGLAGWRFAAAAPGTVRTMSIPHQNQTPAPEPAPPALPGADSTTRRTLADADAVVLAAQVAVAGVLVLTALYAPSENSERAFRLLDWMRRSPEPTAHV